MKKYQQTDFSSSFKIEDIMTKWDLFPRYKGGFNIRKSKSVIQCVDRTKEKKKKRLMFIEAEEE